MNEREIVFAYFFFIYFPLFFPPRKITLLAPPSPYFHTSLTSAVRASAVREPSRKESQLFQTPFPQPVPPSPPFLLFNIFHG